LLLLLSLLLLSPLLLLPGAEEPLAQIEEAITTGTP
jgi:hypothetical protein